MRRDFPSSTVQLSNHPLYSLLVQFPAVCFAATLLTDYVYMRTQLFMWENFSVWILSAGCVLAGITGIVGLIIFLSDRRVRAAHLAWPHALLSIGAALLSVANAFIHSRDGYTAVVPTGLTLSCIVVVLMLLITWMGWNRPQPTSQTGVAA